MRVRSVRAWQGAVLLAFLAAWEWVGGSSPRAKFLVSHPSQIAKELYRLLVEGDFHVHFLTTGAEACLGLLIGSVIGTSAGLLLWCSRDVATIARPFVLAAGAVPVFAFAPLMIVWFGIGFEMKVAMAVFSTVFVAFTQSYRGATLVSSSYVELLSCMRARRSQVFLKIVVPGSLEWVLGALRLNVGFALLGAFIGEFIASSRGLGYLILRSAGLYDVPQALSAALGIVGLALVFDFAAMFVEKKRHKLVQWASVPRAVWKSRALRS